MDINISVKNKTAEAQEQEIVCGNSDYTVNFALDGEWDEYETKTMRVDFLNGTHRDVIFTGNTCEMPVVRDRRRIAIGLYAGDIHTTTPAFIRCRKCITDMSGLQPEPEENVYDQLMERFNAIDGVWYPSVSAAGDISWTRSESQSAPQTVNIKGPAGEGADKMLRIKGVSSATDNTTISFTTQFPAGKNAYNVCYEAAAAGKEVLLEVASDTGDWTTLFRICRWEEDYGVCFSNFEITQSDNEPRIQHIIINTAGVGTYNYLVPAE